MIYSGLSRGLMIWLLAHYLPRSVSKLDRRHTGRPRKRDTLPQMGEGAKGLGEEPNHTTARMVLTKLFNTFWAVRYWLCGEGKGKVRWWVGCILPRSLDSQYSIVPKIQTETTLATESTF